MKEQRWRGDDQTIGQEFRSSRREEEMGMRGANASHGNDYLALGTPRQLDAYDIGELEPSACMMLDTVGMQPHSREYLERDLLSYRSGKKFLNVDGQMIDCPDGIHFGDMP